MWLRGIVVPQFSQLPSQQIECELEIIEGGQERARICNFLKAKAGLSVQVLLLMLLFQIGEETCWISTSDRHVATSSACPAYLLISQVESFLVFLGWTSSAQSLSAVEVSHLSRGGEIQVTDEVVGGWRAAGLLDLALHWPPVWIGGGLSGIDQVKAGRPNCHLLRC